MDKLITNIARNAMIHRNPLQGSCNNLLVARSLTSTTGSGRNRPQSRDTMSRIPQNYEYTQSTEYVPVTIFKAPGMYAREDAHFDQRMFNASGRRHCIHNYIRIQRRKMRLAVNTARTAERTEKNTSEHQKEATESDSQLANISRNNAHIPAKSSSKSSRLLRLHGSVQRGVSTRANRTHDSLGIMIAMIAKFKQNNLIIFDSIQCEVRMLIARTYSNDSTYSAPNNYLAAITVILNNIILLTLSCQYYNLITHIWNGPIRFIPFQMILVTYSFYILNFF